MMSATKLQLCELIFLVNPGICVWPKCCKSLSLRQHIPQKMKRKCIFQTSMSGFLVNFRGCTLTSLNSFWKKTNQWISHIYYRQCPGKLRLSISGTCHKLHLHQTFSWFFQYPLSTCFRCSTFLYLIIDIIYHKIIFVGLFPPQTSPNNQTNSRLVNVSSSSTSIETKLSQLDPCRYSAS